MSTEFFRIVFLIKLKDIVQAGKRRGSTISEKCPQRVFPRWPRVLSRSSRALVRLGLPHPQTFSLLRASHHERYLVAWAGRAKRFGRRAL